MIELTQDSEMRMDWNACPWGLRTGAVRTRPVLRFLLPLLFCCMFVRAGEVAPDPDPAWVADATALTVEIRAAVIAGVAADRRGYTVVSMAGQQQEASVESADQNEIGLKLSGGIGMVMAWNKLDARTVHRLGRDFLLGKDAPLAERLRLGRFCLVNRLYAEAIDELERLIANDKAAGRDEQVQQAWTAAKAGQQALATQSAANKPKAAVTPSKPAKAKADLVPAAVPTTPAAARFLKAVGRNWLMLGITSGPGDKWMAETRTQDGARWDMRYHYITGGVNTPHNWTTWNKPAGQFAELYLAEADRLEVMPVFTLYLMWHSAPGNGTPGGEAVVNKINCNNVDTMRAYFGQVRLLMEKVAAFKKPAILHVEPDLSGFMQFSAAFAPNDPDLIRVAVRATGLADVQAFEDTAAGFGKAIIGMRDRIAPNLLLGYHASRFGTPTPQASASFCTRTGNWDLIFVDPSDRDSGWREAHNSKGIWWDDSHFASFRDWCGGMHKITGLPIMLWQVPVGNTIKASCNNTPGHYMDNRPQYFLDDYPQNRHLQEWAENGVVGILFGGGEATCTSASDASKDGITNPTPCAGNKGEPATVADDDGGFMRQHAGDYYKKGPLRLQVERQK